VYAADMESRTICTVHHILLRSPVTAPWYNRHRARKEKMTNPYKFLIIKLGAAQRLSSFQQNILLHEFFIAFRFVTFFHLWISETFNPCHLSVSSEWIAVMFRTSLCSSRIYLLVSHLITPSVHGRFSWPQPLWCCYVSTAVRAVNSHHWPLGG
jgi:hypothetical protein